MELTEKNIRAAQPGQVLRDATIKGLHLRVFPESRSFYLYYRTKTGTERKPKLGEWGALTLTQARKLAQELLFEVAAVFLGKKKTLPDVSKAKMLWLAVHSLPQQVFGPIVNGHAYETSIAHKKL